MIVINKKLRERLKKAAGVLLPLTPVILAALLLLPAFIGWHSFVVLSGSMEPVCHTGSLLYVRPATPQQVKAGEIITFIGHTGEPVTHRVAEVDTAHELFITKGDANLTTDPIPVSFSALVGKAVFSIPLLGYLSLFVKSAAGMVALGLAVLTAVVLCLWPKKEKPKT